MASKSLLNTTIKFLLACLLVLTGPQMAWSGDRKIRTLLGIGAGALILNEAIKRNKRKKTRKKSPRPAANTRARSSTKTRARSATKRIDPASMGEPHMTRSVGYAVQRGLNAKGFDVGVVDGVVGSGTRRRIKAYQLAIGASATGYLTATQLADLQNAGSGQALAGTTPTEPLSQQEVATLQKSLNALGFPAGKVDGVFGGGTASAMYSFLRSIGRATDTTSQREAVELAAAQAGFTAPISPDVTRVAAGENGEINLLGTLGSDPEGAAANDATMSADAGTGEFNPSSYRSKSASKDFDLMLELSRRAAHYHPEGLAPGKTIQRWVEREFPRRTHGKGKPLATPETVKFYTGTGFERRDAINTLRQKIVSESVGAPLKFITSRQIIIRPGAFVPGKGVPVHFGGDKSYKTARASLDHLEIFLEHLGDDARFYFDNSPEIGYIPTDEAGARALAKMVEDNKYNRLFLRFYVSMSTLGEVVEEHSYGRDYVAKANFDAVEVWMQGRKGAPVANGQSLHVWDLTGGSDDGKPDKMTPEAFAAFAGIPTHRGGLVHRSNYSSGAPEGFGGELERAEAGWTLLQYLGQLGANENLLSDDALLIDYASRTLEPGEKRAIARGKPLFNSNALGRSGLKAFSEFEAVEVLQDLRTNYRDKIVAKTPPFPMQVTDVVQTLLGAYDFDRKAFAINWSNIHGNKGNTGAFRYLGGKFDAKGSLPQKVLPNFKDFPTHLEVEPAKAAQLAKVLEAMPGNKGRRYVYFAMSGSLPTPEIREGRLTYTPKVTRAALFADPNLRKLLRDYPVSNGWDEQTAVDAGAPIPLSEDTAWLWLAKEKPQLLKDAGFVATALKRRQRAERKLPEDRLHGRKYLPRMVLEDVRNADENDLQAFAETYEKIAEFE